MCAEFAEVIAVLGVFDVKIWFIDAYRYFQTLVFPNREVCHFERSTESHVKPCILYNCDTKRVSFVVPQTMNLPKPIDIATVVL